jgi:hypothetical protein
MDTKPPISYLTYGGGVDSTGLLIAANLGLWNVGVVDVAIYVNTGADSPAVLAHVKAVQQYSKIPLHIINSDTSLIDDLLSPKGFVSIPAFLSDRGLLRRQCTNLYKLKFIRRHVRSLLGLRPYQRLKSPARAIIGIGYQERHRTKSGRERWIFDDYPMIREMKTKADCLKLCKQAGFSNPSHSACICCPLKRNSEWCALKGDGSSPTWKTVLKIDEAIRERDFNKSHRRIFLHPLRRPLAEITFTQDSKAFLTSATCLDARRSSPLP